MKHVPDGREKSVLVQVSGSAMASREITEETARAISTQGRTAIDDFKMWLEPPRRVMYFAAQRPERVGGIPEISDSDSAALVRRTADRLREQRFELELMELRAGWAASILSLDRSPSDDVPVLREVESTASGAAERALQRLSAMTDLVHTDHP